MDYWKQCISEAFGDAGIKATDTQIELVAGWVEGAHENYSLAVGLDVAQANYESEEAIKLRQLQKEISDNEDWIRSTAPCSKCITTGTVLDGWGREIACWECEGKGRVRLRF
jgi:hypothetical protein